MEDELQMRTELDYGNMKFEQEVETVNLGWEMGFEPTTFGATVRRSTS